MYVVRHGRTNNNDEGVFNGRNDEDINETGIEQAKVARDELNKVDIDLIVCSPMKRTRHTAEIINERNIPIVFDERLMERDTGELTFKPLNSVNRDEYWSYNASEKFTNSETVPELVKRVYSAMEDIKVKYADKENILIVTHNGVARAICAYFNGIPDDGNMLHYGTHKNCEIKRYEMKK